MSPAAEAMRAVGGGDTFRLVHDTFHHHLAGESALFPELTGLVHISGVDDPDLATDAMRDADRVLVTERDRLGNLEQIRALRQGGYDGYLSFEPFAAAVQALEDPAPALRASMALVQADAGAAPA